MEGKQAKSFIEESSRDFKEYIKPYKPIMEQFAFQYGSNPEQIPDLIQKIYEILLKKRKLIQEEEVSIWIYQIIIKTVKKYYRHQVKTHKDNQAIHKQYADYMAQEHINFQGCLTKLRDSYKLPIILHYFHNKTVDEISLILHISDETVRARLGQGIGLLEEQYNVLASGEAEESQIFLHLIEEMNVIYERLPEFINDQQIAISVEPYHPLRRWRKLLPLIIGGVGLIVFSLISISYLEKEKEQQALVENQQETIIETGDLQGIDKEIVEYFEQAKENLAEEIQINNINELMTVQRVEIILQDLKNTPSDEDVERDHSKDFIDMMLTPPSKLLEQLDNHPNPDEIFVKLLHIATIYQGDFQHYLEKLLFQYDIPRDDYHTLVKLQYDSERYDGPTEIKNLLETLKNQMLMLVQHSQQGNLLVKVDYAKLKEYFIEHYDQEGYIQYLEILESSGDFYYLVEWEDYDEVLLELEYLITNYGDSYSKYFRNYLIQDIYWLLQHFLAGKPGERPLPEEERMEYYRFLENHQSSVLWSIVQTAVQDWEVHDWMKAEVFINSTDLEILFDDRFNHVHINDIQKMFNWPFAVNSIEVYKNFEENQDITIVENLTPLGIVSLYDYAFNKNEKLVEVLLSSSFPNEENGIKEVRRQVEYAVTEYPSDQTAIVHLLGQQFENVVRIHLQKEAGMWKISSID